MKTPSGWNPVACALSLLALPVARALPPAPDPAPVSHLVLLGTTSHGIYEVRLDGATGALSEPELTVPTANASFLALAPGGHFLYTHSQQGQLPDGRAAGAIRSYALDPATGALTPLNLRVTGDPVPSNIAIDGTGRVVMTVSGTGGHILSYPVEPDGRLGPLASRIRNEGPPGPVKARQEFTYPHSSNFAPDNRFVLTCDLGLDRVFTYAFDPATAVLTPQVPPYTQFPPGTGPRHAKFSADGRFFYVVGELASTVTACAYDAATGRIAIRQSLSTLPAGFKGDNLASEIRIHPNGRFVYVGNRGHNSLAVFGRDPATGRLTPLQTIPSGGDFPRNFNLSPDGRWLLCAHQNSDNLTVFAVDPDTGRLTREPSTRIVPKAIAVVFVN
jgi:6-phosphogluconolactonase